MNFINFHYFLSLYHYVYKSNKRLSCTTFDWIEEPAVVDWVTEAAVYIRQFVFALLFLNLCFQEIRCLEQCRKRLDTVIVDVIIGLNLIFLTFPVNLYISESGYPGYSVLLLSNLCEGQRLHFVFIVVGMFGVRCKHYSYTNIVLLRDSNMQCCYRLHNLFVSVCSVKLLYCLYGRMACNFVEPRPSSLSIFIWRGPVICFNNFGQIYSSS
jgi:hypothetical protein